MKGDKGQFIPPVCRLPLCAHSCGDTFGGHGVCATCRFGATSSGQRMSPMGRLPPVVRAGQVTGGLEQQACGWAFGLRLEITGEQMS